MSDATVRVVLPSLLRDLARVQGELTLEVTRPVTQRAVIDAIEAAYPMLRGTLREPATGRRRALVRFYACEEDRSYDDPDAPLPEAVAMGTEPYLVVGAIAGG
jgi:sulfur-carrier protein